MDVRTGPLAIAAKNVAAYGLAGDIELRLSDGLDELEPEEADTIIIAGMGGLLIKSILEKGRKHLLSNKKPEFILQPQSDIKEVRIFLYQNEYHIVQEKMLVEDGKYYTVIKAQPGKTNEYCSDAEWLYGKYNLEQKDAVLYDYLQKQQQTLKEIKGRLEENIRQTEERKKETACKTFERMVSLKEELEVNAAALKYYAE